MTHNAEIQKEIAKVNKARLKYIAEVAFFATFVYVFFAVVGNINELRIELHQRVDGGIERIDAHSFQWRQDFK